MPIHIDSKEVLQHLKNYGIDSIDDYALKSFIKDLKKLIKYEQYKNLYDLKHEQKDISCERNFPDSTTNLGESPVFSSCAKRREKHCCQKNKKENIVPVYSEELSKCKKIHDIPKCECLCKNTNHRISLQPLHSSNNLTSEKTNHKHNQELLNDEKKSKPNVEKGKEEPHSTTRPPSLLSYAKSQSGSVRTRKGHCDPVQLYHYYQSFWKVHKLPGENDHAQLRLAIRKRLMNVK